MTREQMIEQYGKPAILRKCKGCSRTRPVLNGEFCYLCAPPVDSKVDEKDRIDAIFDK